MAMEGRSAVAACFFVILCLSALKGMIAARISGEPLLQRNDEGSGFGFSKSFNYIFDTSKYGILQLNNGLARTPQMGWNSWNFFACNITETVIKETADALVSSGLADLGYVYVNIDDCWSNITRDSKGQLIPDPETFPSGIKALADYVHEKGLKLGIYSDAGVFTCQVRPGSLFHEKDDAKLFASWGVDYLKYDNCFNLGIVFKYIMLTKLRDCDLMSQLSRDVLQVWAGPLSANRLVVALWNRCSTGATITAKWEAIGLETDTIVSIRDLWQHKNVAEDAVTSFGARVNAHDCHMYIFTPKIVSNSVI
ncbi:alpha-galactosidase 3 [Carica papaya]|uniref:alpha-galactosidase 3 n=1 Tax=Carica papaya TaxID=3649 RepID=UPI000B8CB7A6|nr:alpha-galactosidase 3 [Carica papaya]